MSQTPPRRSDFFTKPLLLQNETVYFIFVNCLDIFVTYILLRFGGLESNPVADFFLRIGNVTGLVYFKMFVVAFVLVVAHLVSRSSERRARQLIWAGTAIVAAVVVYSLLLFLLHILLPGNVPEDAVSAVPVIPV